MENHNFTINYDPAYWNPGDVIAARSLSRQAELQVDTLPDLLHSYGQTVIEAATQPFRNLAYNVGRSVMQR